MRNFTVGRIWGIPIRINVSLLVFLPVLAWLIGSGGQIALYAGIIDGFSRAPLDVGALTGGVVPWIVGILAAIGLFVSVTIHELGHSYVARRYGIGIESITLWIFGGVASLSSIPREWDREFWIAIAGPVTSVLTGAAFALAVQVIPASLPIVLFVAGWLAVTNVVLAVFNLVPAFPMDGGRVLRALLARNQPYATATRIAARIGVIFALLFAVVGVLSFNVVLVLVALFVYGAATSESRYVLMDELLENLTVGDIMTREFETVDDDATIADLSDRMILDRRTAYAVTAADGSVVGLVALSDLRRTSRSAHETTTVGEIARDVPRIAMAADAFDSLAVLGGARSDYALVEENGAVSGLLSEADYTHALSIRREFRSGIYG